MWKFPTSTMVSFRGCLMYGGRDYLMPLQSLLRGFSTFSKVSDYGQCVKKCLGFISLRDWMVLRFHRNIELNHIIDIYSIV